MDNIAHTLAGLALVRTGLGRKTRYAGAALVLGSNLPDADLVALVGGRLAFIDAHRGISHSLIGGCALGALLGAGLWALARVRPRAGSAGPDGRATDARPGALIGLALLAVLLHLGFDSLNDYGIRIFLPFTDRWYYGDVIFIVDPWYWLLLGGGAYLAMARRSLFEAAAWTGWAVLSVPVLVDSSPPMPAKALWLLGLATLAAVRFRTRAANRAPSPLWPRAAFAVLALYVLAVAALHARMVEGAKEAVALQERAPVSRLAVIPRPANPWRWNVLYETPTEIVSETADLSGGGLSPGSERRYRKHLDDPRAQRALATPAGKVARGFCRYLFADIDEKDGGAADVSFRDARFAVRGRREFSVFTVHVEP